MFNFHHGVHNSNHTGSVDLCGAGQTHARSIKLLLPPSALVSKHWHFQCCGDHEKGATKTPVGFGSQFNNTEIRDANNDNKKIKKNNVS